MDRIERPSACMTYGFWWPWWHCSMGKAA